MSKIKSIFNTHFLLNGACSFYYYEFLGKKIMLIGDLHLYSFQSVSCPQLIKENKHYNKYKEKYDLLDFLLNLISKFSKNNKCLDLFIESPYSTNELAKYYTIKDSDKNDELYFGKNDNPFWVQLSSNHEKSLRLSSTVYNNKHFHRGHSKRNKNLKVVRTYFNNRCLGKKKGCLKGLRYHATDITQAKDYSFVLDNIILLFTTTINTENINCDDPNFKNVCPKLEDLIEMYHYVVGVSNDDFIARYYLELLLDNIHISFSFEEVKYISNENLADFIRLKYDLLFNQSKYEEIELIEMSQKCHMLKMKFIDFDINNLNKMRNKIIKQLNNLDENYVNAEILINYYEDLLKKNYLNDDYIVKGFAIRYSTMELYTCARMFRKFEKKKDDICDNYDESLANIVYYAGNSHILNIKDFLEEIFDVKPYVSIDLDQVHDVSSLCLMVPKSFNYFRNSYFFNTFINEDESWMTPTGRYYPRKSRKKTIVKVSKTKKK